MKKTKVLGVIFLVSGILLMIYGSYIYTQKTSTAKLLSIEFTASEQQTAYTPIWIGVSAIFVGGILILAKKKII